MCAAAVKKVEKCKIKHADFVRLFYDFLSFSLKETENLKLRDGSH